MPYKPSDSLVVYVRLLDVTGFDDVAQGKTQYGPVSILKATLNRSRLLSDP